MAGRFQKKENNEQEKNYAKIDSFSVNRVKAFEWGTTFDLTVNGVTIYGCRALTSREGVDFISFPSRKGSNDKYYNIAYVPLSGEDVQKILFEVEKGLQ